MEHDPKDVDIIDLLKKLKETNGPYPREMLALRRQGYLRQVADISAGAGLAVGLKNAAKGGNGAALPPAAGTAVEILLIAAILAEAGAVTYFYRDRIAEYVNSFSREPRVEEVANPPVLVSPIAEIEFSPTPTIVFTQSVTGTPSPTGTPPLELAGNPTNQGGGNHSSNQPGLTPNSTPRSTTGTTADSTPGSRTGTTPDSATEPNQNNGNDGNNGNHYGQTPKPDRTKEPGNNISEQNRENNTVPTPIANGNE